MFKPEFTTTITEYVSSNEGGGANHANIPCSMWEMSRWRGSGRVPFQGKAIWCCASAFTNPIRDGWHIDTGKWNPLDAYRFSNWSGSGFGISWWAIGWGVHWANTPFQHRRVYLIDGYNFDLGAISSSLPLPIREGGISLTFDVYRPFGAAAPVLAAAPGVFYADPVAGRGSYSGGNYITWDSYLECSSSLDVRDGLFRPAGTDTIGFANGDEVRVPTGVNVSRYVVVRVVRFTTSSGSPAKRVYLLRDQPFWPGP